MRRLLTAAALLMVAAIPCAAQDAPKAELSVGYNMLKFSDETFPGGWYADVARNVGSSMAVVGQVTGNYKSVDFEGIDVGLKYHSFAGGLRWLGRGPTSAGFAHVLIGMSNANASSNASGLLDFNVSDSQRDTFMQLGGGINLMTNAPIGLRIGVDYARIMTNGGENVIRFATGIVIPMGR